MSTKWDTISRITTGAFRRYVFTQQNYTGTIYFSSFLSTRTFEYGSDPELKCR